MLGIGQSASDSKKGPDDARNTSNSNSNNTPTASNPSSTAAAASASAPAANNSEHRQKQVKKEPGTLHDLSLRQHIQQQHRLQQQSVDANFQTSGIGYPSAAFLSNPAVNTMTSTTANTKWTSANAAAAAAASTAVKQEPGVSGVDNKQHQTPMTDSKNEDELVGNGDNDGDVALAGVTIESPSSPGEYNRMRSSADSDAGSSSCKDIDESDVLAPDSVPALISELRQLLDYVASKPKLHHGSASFIRDYLRTMLLKNAKAAADAIQTANNNNVLCAKYEAAQRAAAASTTDPSVTPSLTLMRHEDRAADLAAALIKHDEQLSILSNDLNFNAANAARHAAKREEFFKRIPDDVIKHILSFLDGRDLARSREVCRKWNDVCDDQLWKALCLERWHALESDDAVWKLIDKSIDVNKEDKWRRVFPKVLKTPQWKCRLQKTGRFICNLVAHQISGASLSDTGLPNVLVVERRFNIMHLATFVLPDASVLYFEPEKESDRAGFDDFIQYLDRRTRAGLALEEQRRFIFIPPCEYTRNQVDYQGKSLLGVVQHAYPPLAP